MTGRRTGFSPLLSISGQSTSRRRGGLRRPGGPTTNPPRIVGGVAKRDMPRRASCDRWRQIGPVATVARRPPSCPDSYCAPLQVPQASMRKYAHSRCVSDRVTRSRARFMRPHGALDLEGAPGNDAPDGEGPSSLPTTRHSPPGEEAPPGCGRKGTTYAAEREQKPRETGILTSCHGIRPEPLIH